MIGLVICDPDELLLLGKEERFKFIGFECGFEFYKYKFKDHDMRIVVSGVGIPQASAGTQALIMKFGQMSKIFNLGAVGGDGQKCSVFDIVIPERIYYSGVITPWYEYGQYPKQKKYFDNALSGGFARKYLITNLASGSEFINNQKRMEEIQKQINVGIFDMESAAVCNVASNNDIPCYVIKCVSDLIGRDDTSQRESLNERIAQATKYAFDAFKKFL